MQLTLTALQGPIATIQFDKDNLSVTYGDLLAATLVLFPTVQAEPAFSYKNKKLPREYFMLLHAAGIHDQSIIKIISMDPAITGAPCIVESKNANDAPPAVSLQKPKPAPPVLILHDWLFQSGQSSVSCHGTFEHMKNLKINHIFNITEEVKYNVPPELADTISVHHFPLADAEHADIGTTFAKAFEKLKAIREQNPESKIVIHCLAGVSRSCAVATAMIMLVENWGMQQALDHLRQRRDEAKYGNTSPNSGFLQHLQQLEKQYNLG